MYDATESSVIEDQNEFSFSNALDKIAPAVVKAQAELMPATKDSANPFLNTKYADLNSVWNAVRKTLTDNGLCVVQGPIGDSNGNIGVATLLLHASGQWIKCVLKTKPSKYDPQLIGSLITYFKRYCLSGVTSVCTEEDDDGEAAMNRQKTAVKPKPASRSFDKTPELESDLNKIRAQKSMEALIHAVNEVKDKYSNLKNKDILNKIKEAATSTKQKLLKTAE